MSLFDEPLVVHVFQEVYNSADYSSSGFNVGKLISEDGNQKKL